MDKTEIMWIHNPKRIIKFTCTCTGSYAITC